MHLIPREVDKLNLHSAGLLAQRRLARGLRLNIPESIALISAVILERIRDGEMSVAELMDHGRQLLGQNQVLDGVAAVVDSVQIEGTFPDGTKLVTVHGPIAQADGDLTLALHGSFFPVPDVEIFHRPPHGSPDAPLVPGEILPVQGTIELNPGRASIALVVVNRGDRPVQVGSHYSFIEVNRKLEFDREAAYGRRLDIPAGTSVRFEPGEQKTVQLIEFAGDRHLSGGNSLATGPCSDSNRAKAIDNVRDRGFSTTSHSDGEA